MEKKQHEYFNYYDLFRIERNVETENGILFRAMLDNWDRLNDLPYWTDWQKAIHHTIVSKNRFQANPPDDGDHFSRDNMLGLYSICKIHDMKQTIKQLPLMTWNGYKWYNPKNWHPNTWAVFLAFKYPIFKYNPLIYIMALFSLLATDYKNTSGKNLWFLTLTVLNIHWPLRWAEKRFRKKGLMAYAWHLFEYSHDWYFSGEKKFDNRDNPLRENVRMYYKSSSIKRDF